MLNCLESVKFLFNNLDIFYFYFYSFSRNIDWLQYFIDIFVNKYILDLIEKKSGRKR